MQIAMKILLRWIASALGLWIAGRLLGGVVVDGAFWTLIWAGLALAIINSFIKPLVVMFSLSAIVFSLGLFILVINGFMVWLTARVVAKFDFGTFEIDDFGTAVLAGLIVGLVNYVVTMFIEKRP